MHKFETRSCLGNPQSKAYYLKFHQCFSLGSQKLMLGLLVI